MAARSTSITSRARLPNSSLPCHGRRGHNQRREAEVSVYILVVDDEPDVEALFRQQFRRDIRSGRFTLEFAMSAPAALERAKSVEDPSLILILSDINMPGMTGLEMLPRVRSERPDVPVIMITA